MSKTKYCVGTILISHMPDGLKARLDLPNLSIMMPSSNPDVAKLLAEEQFEHLTTQPCPWWMVQVVILQRDISETGEAVDTPLSVLTYLGEDASQETSNGGS